MRRSLILAAKIIISGTLLAFAISRVDVSLIRLRLDRIDWLWMGAAVGTAFLQILLGAVRWCYVAVECNISLGLTSAIRYNLIGSFFNNFLLSTVGGDFMRIWLVGRSERLGDATYSVLGDRAVGLIAAAIIVIVSLPWSSALIADQRGKIALALLDLAAISGCGLFLMTRYVSWPWFKTWWLTRHIQGCAVVTHKVLFNVRSGPPVVFISLLLHVLTVVTSWSIANAIYAPVKFFDLYLLVLPISLLTTLPISISGWGLREASMMIAFNYANLAPDDGLLISILSRIATFSVGAMGSLIWILSPEKAKGGTLPKQ